MSQLVPEEDRWIGCELFPTMYNDQWMTFTELKPGKISRQFDGMNCGVPTRTTPTITPVTPTNLRNLEYYDQTLVESHQNEAGFVPPPVTSSINGALPITVQDSIGGGNMFVSMVDKKSLHGGIMQITDSMSNLSGIVSPPMSVDMLADGNSSSGSSTSSGSSRKSIGGRRPTKKCQSPEEEERARLRRERNKIAAARCRKRRLDHTNELREETEELERKRREMLDEIDDLNALKDELELSLQSHPDCRLRGDSPVDVKPSIVFMDVQRVSPQPAPTAVPVTEIKPLSRPTSLPVSLGDKLGISITTPSHGLSLNFESLMEGGTGLTPIVNSLGPSCGTQQRHMPLDLASPENGNKLVSL